MEPMRQMIAAQSQESYAAFQRQSSYLRSLVTSPANFERVLGWATTSHPAAVADGMFEVATTDLRDSVAAIRSPLLVLGSWYGFKGMSTRDAVEANFRTQYAKVGRWSFATADSARHFLMLDDPDWTWGRVDAFLDSLGAAAPGAAAAR